MTLTQFLYLLAFISVCSALECYVCKNQPHNKDKCIKTTKQCEEEQKACVTIIKWSQPPFWVPRAERIHTLEKNCVHFETCERASDNLGKTLRCKRDWFKDWVCIECCRGDLCNYYVTMGVASTSSWLPLTISAIIISTLNYVYHSV